MTDFAPQTASGKVLFHFTMSLDGFVAGPGHAMDWMSGRRTRPAWSGVRRDHRRRSWPAGTAGTAPSATAGRTAGAWQGPIFVLTHHPEDAPARGRTSPS